MRTLVDAGFQKQDAVEALARSGGDADEATLLLLGDELTPARITRPRRTPHELNVGEFQRGGPDWGGSLPQEVLEVLGRWLNQHLGAFDGRPRLKPIPEYLHPLAINKYRATHSLKEIESGRTRLVATREMLLALRACRQSCRVWRDEISYRGVTELALDGVLHIGRLSALKGMYGLPSLEQMIVDAGRANSQLCQPNIYTWWPGHRTLQDISRRPRESAADAKQLGRCPACRTPQPRQQNRGKHPTLKQFMTDQGIGNWFGAVVELLGVTSIAALRQMTAYELMDLARKHNYSESQMLEAAPKVIAKIAAGKDWESRRASQGFWSRDQMVTNSQKYLVHTHCEECGLGCVGPGTGLDDDSSNPSMNCETCGFIYCSDCAAGNYTDSRPQTVDAILPDDFPERFSNLTTLSLCDLELPYLPALLARCTNVTSLNASGNCLRSLRPQASGVAEVDRVSTDDLVELPSVSTVLPPGLQKLDLSGRSQWADTSSVDSARVQSSSLHTLRPNMHQELSAGSLPTSLQELRLSNLGLQRVPEALRECAELRTLDLSYNNLVIRRDWTGLFPAAEGGVPGGSPWEEGDFSEEIWLGELRFLGELNLCNAATVISQGGNGPGGALTPAQIMAATAYFTQRTQLLQQRQQARDALEQTSETLRSKASQEHAAFKAWQAASSRVQHWLSVLSRCDLNDQERRARLAAERDAATAQEAVAAATRAEATAEHEAASAARGVAVQAHQTVVAAIANLGPPPVALGAWQVHNQGNLAQLIRAGTPLTEQVLQTLAEEHWLRKWNGQLQLVESYEDC